MLASKYFKLSGQKHDGSYFKFHESNSTDFDVLHDVLKGKILGLITHHAISSEDCKIVTSNFWKSEMVRERNDGVPAVSIGAYHYKKELEEYFNQIHQGNKHIEKLFDGTANFVDSIIDQLKVYFAHKNILFRVARHNERDAARFVVRSCHSDSDFVILPHDDIAQCQTRKQKGFEVENIPDYEMIAVNICLENNNGGHLNIWNIQPDDFTRHALNIEETGYPYPPYLVEEFDKITVPIRQGDMYCFNGRNIHAVTSSMRSRQYRTTITFFMGYINDNTIIYWT